MSASKIDKKIKNARLAIERATTSQQKARAERDLTAALRTKDTGKVIHR